MAKENAWLKRAIWNTQIFNKWPQENAWLKRAIWNTQIFNKWPQENAWLKRAIWNTEINATRERLAQTSNLEYTNIQ